MTVDYASLIKKLVVPEQFTAPRTMTYAGITATALDRSHLRDDVAGINSSLELIRRTRGGGWPTEPVTEDFNYVDLVWHEQEFREGTSFSYVLYQDDGPYVGCCYLYPLGRRTPLTADLAELDVDVSWWVTQDAYARGGYTTVHTALGHWLAELFPFWPGIHYSNAELPDA